MKSFRICIHSHCYQPDRTNPWTGEVDEQASAAPFRDWNERITAECYRPNAVVGNYRYTSFNFGPTLLGWLERNAPETYVRIIESDRLGRERFNGHGPAIAQAWGHSILPLDNERDRRTQVIWGVADFEHRFGRKPEGMWLAETAVDIPTLETLADNGIRFTILAPHQASGMSKPAPGVYICPLPSEREIAICLYDGLVANEIAFQGLLADGDRLAERLLSAGKEFTHVATDGETYGHHHRGGEAALARCLERLEDTPGMELTVYGRYIADHPPEDRSSLVERSSWSCVHGIERWRRGCGCDTGLHPGWQQDWRVPLRAAVEWLRDTLALFFEERLGLLVSDPWKLRDDYIEVMLDNSAAESVFCRHARSSLTGADRRTVGSLLEMQRWTMLSFTSCGWFFDDISEPATVQVMRSAARAMQLCDDNGGPRLEEGFVDILHNARSNMPELGTGADIYRNAVEGSRGHGSGGR